MNDEEEYIDADDGEISDDAVMEDDSGVAQISEYEKEKRAAEKAKRAEAAKKKKETATLAVAADGEDKKPAKKKAAKKKAKKKAAKKKKSTQAPSVKMGENKDKGLEFHEGEYKGHKMFVIFKDGARRMSFGLGKAQKLVECETEIKAWVEKQIEANGGMEDD